MYPYLYPYIPMQDPKLEMGNCFHACCKSGNYKILKGLIQFTKAYIKTKRKEIM